jgi:putative transposase
MAAIANKDTKCQRIDRMIAGGMGVTESCREIGISEKTFYRWRKARHEANDR